MVLKIILARVLIIALFGLSFLRKKIALKRHKFFLGKI